MMQEQAALTEKRVCCALEKTAEVTVEAFATEPSSDLMERQECDTATLFDSGIGRPEENDVMTAIAVVAQGVDQEQKRSHESVDRVEREARQAVSVSPPSLSPSLFVCSNLHLYLFHTLTICLSRRRRTLALREAAHLKIAALRLEFAVLATPAQIIEVSTCFAAAGIEVQEIDMLPEEEDIDMLAKEQAGDTGGFRGRDDQERRLAVSRWPSGEAASMVSSSAGEVIQVCELCVWVCGCGLWG